MHYQPKTNQYGKLNLFADPHTAWNGTIYYSPTKFKYGENITFWGDGIWPRKFTRGRIVSSAWYEAMPDPIYKTMVMHDCTECGICDLNKGDHVKDKKVIPLRVYDNNKWLPKEMLSPGVYKLRCTLFDHYDEIFACLEISGYASI